MLNRYPLSLMAFKSKAHRQLKVKKELATKMKYLLLTLLFLTSCGNGNAESNGIRIGGYYTVVRGFYAGCTGYATDYSDYSSIDDSVTLKEVICENVMASFIIVNPKDLKAR